MSLKPQSTNSLAPFIIIIIIIIIIIAIAIISSIEP